MAKAQAAPDEPSAPPTESSQTNIPRSETTIPAQDAPADSPVPAKDTTRSEPTVPAQDAPAQSEDESTIPEEDAPEIEDIYETDEGPDLWQTKLPTSKEPSISDLLTSLGGYVAPDDDTEDESDEEEAEAVKPEFHLGAISKKSVIREFVTMEDEERGTEIEEEEERVEKEEKVLPITEILGKKPFFEVEPWAESDYGLAELPAAILADREAMIQKLRELMAEGPELKRKNRYLEYRCIKHMRKIQNMTPNDVTVNLEALEKIYMKILGRYKLNSEEIKAQREQIQMEVDCFQEKDTENFGLLTSRERAIAVGLIFAKSGRKLTEKAVDAIIRRQVIRRTAMAHARYLYIIRQHRFEVLDGKLHDVDTLGTGLTILDYEALRLSRNLYADKIDERNRELEKLRFQIHTLANLITHHGAKEAALAEDIVDREEHLVNVQHRMDIKREIVVKMHAKLGFIRRLYSEKQNQAGLLIHLPELREMEKVMKIRDALKEELEHFLRYNSVLEKRRRPVCRGKNRFPKMAQIVKPRPGRN